ncbi:hypothetical protein EST38_g1314 [Candolleomyces aberdarensis]|uniref:N-acetyltransferase domain-containing protein n=1 Tax=Candolleomyces aberdarensis TaxID=2316362 RepID=A0A4Q2DXR3_9AGAR|nr:hypothetical protein EST38_g1314 [Candolleomyces aberdarensis]
MNPQLGTLELNPKTGEPFLRLYSHHDIIITPPRWDDGPQFIPYLNDPLVYEWMQGPPVPYTEADAQSWLNHIIPPKEAVLKQLEEARDQPELITVDHCPVSILRKVNEDGSQIFIGAVDIIRYGGGEVVISADNPGVYTLDVEKKEENTKINMERAPGDPEIIWDFGDYVAPAYHGQGIMTDAVKTIMTKWAVPRMNAHKIVAGTFAANIGSQRVFEKNGFKHIGTLKDYVKKLERRNEPEQGLSTERFNLTSMHVRVPLL